MSGTGGTQFIASVVHPVDEIVAEMARTPTSKPLSVSSCLLVLRVNRPEARPVAQERDPPTVGRHAPRAARVHCAPGSVWYPVATSCDPPVSLTLFGGISGTGGTQFIVSVVHPVDEKVDETACTPTSNPLSVSSCLLVLRVNRPEARPVAQEHDPPTVGRPAPRAARVHCAPGIYVGYLSRIVGTRGGTMRGGVKNSPPLDEQE